MSRSCFALDLDLRAPLNHAGRTQALRSGHLDMDAEPRRDIEWWGKSVLLTFDWAGSRAFQK